MLFGGDFKPFTIVVCSKGDGFAKKLFMSVKYWQGAT